MAVLLAGASGCNGVPVHRVGDAVQSVRVLVGDPIPGKRLAWNSDGRANTVSVGEQQHWYVTDRLAIGSGVMGTWFEQSERDVLGGELQGMSRYQFAESGDTSYFWDLNGGLLLTTRRVPDHSTSRNYTFDFGPGFETPLGGGLRLLGGFEFHHLSNALGRRSPRNESQNEVRYWLGLGWSL